VWGGGAPLGATTPVRAGAWAPCVGGGLAGAGRRPQVPRGALIIPRPGAGRHAAARDAATRVTTSQATDADAE
jgi:hypothetical protein